MQKICGVALNRVESLRKLLAEGGHAAVFITNPVNVSYVSGFSGTAGSLLVTEKKAYLLTDFRYLEQARSQAGDFEVVDIKNAPGKLTAALLSAESVASLAVEAEHMTVDAYGKLSADLSGIALAAIPTPVAALRKVKTAEEIEAIATAVRLGDKAFCHILKQIKAGVREREIALELEFFMRRNGASGLSFEMIVASGNRSALPHGAASDKPLAHGDAVVLDFGCIVNGYCSDLTRTVFIGETTKKQRETYQAVLDAQLAALQELRPGLTGREADAPARRSLAGKGLSEYFGHGLGHGLGREVHEAPRLSPVSEEMLTAGMVVTVEPGVYLAGEFGVRIEDVAVLEEHGARLLTESSKELFCL